MTEENHRRLRDRLGDRLGDGAKFGVRYTEDSSELLFGEQWMEANLEEAPTRSVEKMHDDAVYRLEQAVVSGKLYGTDVDADVRVTDDGLAVYVYPSRSSVDWRNQEH